MKIFNCIFLDRVKRKIRKYIYKVDNIKDDKEYLIKYGKIRLGYKMNLDNPKTINEKLNWYKLNYRNDLMVTCTDKYSAKQFVREKGLEHILVKDYGVYDKVEDIDLNKLPNSFVAKVTGDSGGVVICKNKENFYKQAENKFNNLDKDYSNENKEWHYHHIKNKIIVEDLIETEDGHSPKDYKIFCFNGEPKFLFVASERDVDVKFDFFDLDWNHINVKQGHLNAKNKIKKPEKFDEMLDICRVLSKDFPHVRVDLYYENGKIYFGELTFFHFSGMTPFHPKKYDYIFGEYFDISSISKK